MKLEKTSIQIFLLKILALTTLLAVVSSASLKKEESRSAVSAEAERHRAHLRKKMNRQATPAAAPAPLFNATNTTLSSVLYKNLNLTFQGHKSEHFKIRTRDWQNNKIFDVQLDIIYKDFLHGSDREITPQTTRDIIALFTSEFEACDVDNDYVLSPSEFEGCFKNDTFLSNVKPPSPNYANYVNNSYTNSTGFHHQLFKALDAYEVGYLNFYDYMLIRLYAYSWKKCSVVAPFIEELMFECAMDIAAGYKSMSRTTARRVYQMGLDNTNALTTRNLDFVTFTGLATSIRTFGLINNRGDNDASINEFNTALDANLLPIRYNQDIINQMFKLVEDHDNPTQGMDLTTFIFYDNCLKLFDQPNPTRRWFQDLDEFTAAIASDSFTFKGHLEIQRIPVTNLTVASYNMYPYLNISKVRREDDHFIKFMEKSQNRISKARVRSSYSPYAFNITSWILPHLPKMNIPLTVAKLFNVLDYDQDGFITFTDFGNFMQVIYLFDKYDKYHKGFLYAGDIFEKFSTFSEFPTMSYHIRERAKRFNLLSQDVYVDLLKTLTFFKIDDIMEANVRRSDKSTLYEVELKHILNVISLDKVPNGYLERCLRAPDENGVPKYDWECAFIKAISITIQVLETQQFYKASQLANVPLVNTEFYNVDPDLQSQLV